MKNTHDFGNWSHPSTFSVARVVLTQKSNELADLSNYFSSLVITTSKLRDYAFVKLLRESLNQLIQQMQEITSFLDLHTHINREHPANLKAEMLAIDIENFANDMNRNLRRLTVRQISTGNTFQLENQVKLSRANLAIVLSSFCRTLQEIPYHALFLCTKMPVSTNNGAPPLGQN